jgi:hypothetical protein
MSTLTRARRALSSACAPLLHRIAGGQPSALARRRLERSLVTSSLCVREDAGSSQAPLWSRATFARSKFASGYTALAPKTLEQIMKIETVIFSPPEEITEIWNDVRPTFLSSALSLWLLVFLSKVSRILS